MMLALIPLALQACIKYRILSKSRPFGEIVQNAPALRARKSGHTTSDISRAIRIAARFVPGANCLPQALAMRELMHRYGRACEVQLGVDTAGSFRAHAWVTSEGTIVHGDIEEHFTTLEMSGVRSMPAGPKA